MAINKANFLIQKSHLQDGKIQISQSLFAIWMAFLLAVEFPRNVTDILSPLGGISQTDDLILFGIHSTK